MAAAGSDILRRVPPQNIEAEESVLGAILLENDAVNAVLEVAGVDDFYRESHRLIFRRWSIWPIATSRWTRLR